MTKSPAPEGPGRQRESLRTDSLPPNARRLDEEGGGGVEEGNEGKGGGVYRDLLRRNNGSSSPKVCWANGFSTGSFLE